MMMRYLWIGATLTLFALMLCMMAGCSARRDNIPWVEIPRLEGDVTIDGKLDEACYTSQPLVGRFVLAGSPEQPTSATRAWVFWNKDRLVYGFECEDANVIARPPTDQERDAETQDRVELFFWSGRPGDSYYCFEHAPEGALHDSRAKFQSKIDRSWTATGYRAAFQRTPAGYTAEGEFPRALLESMGFHLRPGEKWRLGLFRADYDSEDPGSVHWLTWVDREGKPNFHVAESFGHVTLQ